MLIFVSKEARKVSIFLQKIFNNNLAELLKIVPILNIR